MNAITFKQFMETFNFRDFNPAGTTEDSKYNSKIIRIYVDECEAWFDFGIDAFHSKSLQRLLEKIFSKDIIQSTVSSMTYINEIGMLKIYLETEQGD